MIFFLFILNFTINDFRDLEYKRAALSEWDKSRGVYATVMSNVGQIGNIKTDLDLSIRLSYLHDDLSKHHNSFIMNSGKVRALDMGLLSEGDPYLSSWGYNVLISPNYLNFNPIVGVEDKVDVKSQIVYQDDVLNILVPEYLRDYEEIIIDEYLEYFYFYKTDIDNMYRRDIGMEMGKNIQVEDLNINIIYVKNNQAYFSFNPRVRIEHNNNIIDPIAIIYTGNIHPSMLSSVFSNSYFFHTTSLDAYGEILPLLEEHGLNTAIQMLDPMFDLNGRTIVDLRERYIKNVAVLILSAVANFIITYSFVVNYFDKNRLKLFIKCFLVYSMARRNSFILLTLLIYNALFAPILINSIGFKALFIVAILILADISMVLAIENKTTMVHNTAISARKGEKRSRTPQKRT